MSAPDHEHRYAFAVAVVGDPHVMEPWQVRRLVELLVDRHRGARRIVLLGGSGGPELGWAHDLQWTVHLVPTLGSRVKRDCEFVYQADAVIVLGDPAPWGRLVALCREAAIPVRVYRECPRLPAPKGFDPDRMYRGES